MKTIGLIGGTTWVSTIEYYKAINEMVSERLGGLNSAQCLLYSFNYDIIADINKRQDWDASGKVLLAAAKKIGIVGCGLYPSLRKHDACCCKCSSKRIINSIDPYR